MGHYRITVFVTSERSAIRPVPRVLGRWWAEDGERMEVDYMPVVNPDEGEEMPAPLLRMESEL
jgi:hypothetical protein